MKEHFCSAEKSMITYEGSCNWCGESEGSMTQDEIIEMAREAGFEIDCCSLDWHKRITAFANLVAAKVTQQEQDRCCAIVFGQCESDNVAQRTVNAIRGKA